MTLAPTQNRSPLSQGMGKLLISTDFLLEGESVALRLGRPTDWQPWRDLRSQSRAFLTPWEPTWLADALTYNAYTQMLERQWRDWKDDRGYAFLVFLKDSAEGSETARPYSGEDEAQTDQATRAAASGDEKKAFFSQFGRRASDFSLMREMSERKPTGETNKKPEKKLGTMIGSVAVTDIVRGAALKGTLGYWIGAPYARQGLMTEATRLVCDFAFNVLKLHRLEASCMPANEPSLNLLRRLGFEQEGTAKAALRINGRWEDHATFALIGD